MAGVDIALWDIKGKALGQPIVRPLGGQLCDKMRVTDVGYVEAIRNTISDENDFMLDVSLAWDATTTHQNARLSQPYHLFWIEEPLRPDDHDGYAKVSRGCLQHIAAGEQECSIVG